MARLTCPGCVFTPPPVARILANSALRAWRESPWGTTSPGAVLDPACGDGALLAAFAEACCPAVLSSLYGVDVDPRGLEIARARLTDSARFSCGNALSGPALVERDGTSWSPSGLNWNHVFPEIAQRGGFDLLIANPPYIRERGAKELFDEIRGTPLGELWRRPRMDLWHYFFHRGLELLRPGGVFTLIVPSYFATATSAATIRARMQRETRLVELMDLDRWLVFPGVQGRHVILTLRKESPRATDRVLLAWPSTGQSLSRNALSVRECVLTDPFEERADHAVPWQRGDARQSELLSETRLSLRPLQKAASPIERAGSGDSGSALCLGDLFQVRQGIAENPPRLTVSHAAELGASYREGMGVFVLSDEERRALELSATEHDCLRPYFAAAEIGRYRISTSNTGWLLYLTRDTCPDLEKFPSIRNHLRPFEKILRRRREVQLGKIAWWHLHWPRRESLFMQPRILAPQMVRRPMFHFETNRPTFVNFSVNVISVPEGDQAAERLYRTTGVSDREAWLRGACGLLNASPAAEWFQQHAKHRGAALDISGAVLKDLPLPDLPPREWQRLAELVDKRNLLDEGSSAVAPLERAIDDLFVISP